MTIRVRRFIGVCAATVAIAGVPAPSALAGSGSGGSTSSSSDAGPPGLPPVAPGPVVDQGGVFLRQRSPLTVQEGVDQLDQAYAAIGCTRGSRVNVAVYYLCPP